MTILYGKEARDELVANLASEGAYPDVGEQVKVCHSTCPAGVDKRNRFSVANKGGAYLFHCFNCGNSGYWRPKELSALVDRIPPTTLPSIKLATNYHDLVRPLSLTKDKNKFSTEARLWLAEYDMLDSLYATYEEHTSSVYLGLYGVNTHTFGHQLRHFDGEQKYTTATTNTSWGSHYGEKNQPPIIVEDALSAMKIADCGGYGYALLGTSIRTNMPKSKTAVLWLDKDVAGQTAAAKLATELSPIYPNLITVFDDQPKEKSKDELIKFTVALRKEPI